MPFGTYKDFKACVLANKDKESPEGYCSALHKKITGRYPSEKEKLEADIALTESFVKEKGL